MASTKFPAHPDNVATLMNLLFYHYFTSRCLLILNAIFYNDSTPLCLRLYCFFFSCHYTLYILSKFISAYSEVFFFFCLRGHLTTNLFPYVFGLLHYFYVTFLYNSQKRLWLNWPITTYGREYQYWIV